MRGKRPSTPAAFEEFEAATLYCDRCRAALPVRQRLLLVLPDGDLYEYRCSRCNQPVGKKKDQRAAPRGVLIKPGSSPGGS